MQDKGVKVDVIGDRNMKLHRILVFLEENVFHEFHFLPIGAPVAAAYR